MFVFFSLQLPEVIEVEMSTSVSNPISIQDCTDDSQPCNQNADVNNRMPLSPTLPSITTGSNDRKPLQALVRFPIEYSTLPSDGQDLLSRLLEYRPESRIRTIFSLQRIAFFMGFSFDDAKKKKVGTPLFFCMNNPWTTLKSICNFLPLTTTFR